MFPSRPIPRDCFVIELTDVLEAFCREHECKTPEVVSNVSVEQLKHAAATSAATVAQPPEVPAVQVSFYD